MPIPADPHPSADNSGIIDWTLVALAAGALLVAAVVAGSGARLASVIEERP